MSIGYTLPSMSKLHFLFLTLGHSGAKGCVPECPNVRNEKCRLDLDDTEHFLESIIITGTDVLITIQKLKRKLSCGPDGLPPILFKELASSLSESLALLFNQLLSVEEVPDDWLKVIIIPVFKKGASGTLSNHRPVSLTSVSSKIMERIVSNKIYNLFSNYPRCFVSCPTRLR